MEDDPTGMETFALTEESTGNSFDAIQVSIACSSRSPNRQWKQAYVLSCINRQIGEQAQVRE